MTEESESIRFFEERPLFEMVFLDRGSAIARIVCDERIVNDTIRLQWVVVKSTVVTDENL